MKNKGLIITMIVMLFIIVLALIIFMYCVISRKWIFNFGMKHQKIIFEENYEVNSVDDIEILSSTGDIKFEENNEDKIRVVAYGENSNDVKVSLNGSKLKIDYSDNKNMIFGINFYKSDIIVYVPENLESNIKIDSDYGDISILDLENSNVDIKADCGDISIGKIKNIVIDSDYGDVKIDSVLNKLDIKSDCGDIKIDKVNLLENSKIKSDLGDIKIGETNDIYIDSHVDLGDVKIGTNNRHSEVILKIESDCGDIKVEN